MKRLEVLIDEGMILTMPDTYTGHVLKFLREGKMIRYGRRVQSCGLGSLSDADVQDVVARALRHARELVANIRAYMLVYRSEHGWMRAYRAFRFCNRLVRLIWVGYPTHDSTAGLRKATF